MNIFKKALAIMVFLFSVVFVTQDNQTSAAKLEDSPRTGYELFSLNSDYYFLYTSTTSKKYVKIPYAIESEQYGYVFNMPIVKKFIKGGKWVYVSVKDKTTGKVHLGYLKTNTISPNFNAADYVIIGAAEGVNLREKKDVKSKKLITIPYGTRVDFGFQTELNNKTWTKVSYVYKGKRYIGYVKNIFLLPKLY